MYTLSLSHSRHTRVLYKEGSPESSGAYEEKVENKLTLAQKKVLEQVMALLDNIDTNKNLQKEFKTGLLDKVTSNPEMLDKLLDIIEHKMLTELKEIQAKFQKDGDRESAIDESRASIHKHIHMQTLALKNSLESSSA